MKPAGLSAVLPPPSCRSRCQRRLRLRSIAIGRQGVERYERALQRLRPADREAIIGRLELQHEYRDLAVILGKPNANAARVAVTRALARLMEELDVA
jgi:DNA-directed RNA polymerase specialized sigma24 family protein